MNTRVLWIAGCLFLLGVAGYLLVLIFWPRLTLLLIPAIATLLAIFSQLEKSESRIVQIYRNRQSLLADVSLTHVSIHAALERARKAVDDLDKLTENKELPDHVRDQIEEQRTAAHINLNRIKLMAHCVDGDLELAQAKYRESCEEMTQLSRQLENDRLAHMHLQVTTA